MPDPTSIVGASRMELAAHCRALSEDLRSVRSRSPEERRDLAERCALLLSELASQLAPLPMSPEWLVDAAPPYGLGLSEAFLRLYEVEERFLREYVLHRARALVTGKTAPHIGGHLVGWTYDDFVRELGELERQYSDQRSTPR